MSLALLALVFALSAIAHSRDTFWRWTFTGFAIVATFALGMNEVLK